MKKIVSALIIMSGNYLLDTNIAIGLLEGEQSIKDHVDEADLVYISSTILGELYFGATKSSRKEHNFARIQRLLTDISLYSTARKILHLNMQSSD